jgi:hypothetical protein
MVVVVHRVLAAISLLIVLVADSCTSERPAPVPARILSPAPRPPVKTHECPYAPSRASSVTPKELAGVLDDHVPRWLPEGMGLVFAFGPGDASFGGAYFANIRCREIELWFWDSTGVGSGEGVDGWVVSESGPHDCGNASSERHGASTMHTWSMADTSACR